MDVLISGAGVRGPDDGPMGSGMYGLQPIGSSSGPTALVVSGYKIHVRGTALEVLFSGPGFTRTSSRRARTMQGRDCAFL
jgi:hypothetical protein